jgi:hypothetical protein
MGASVLLRHGRLKSPFSKRYETQMRMGRKAKVKMASHISTSSGVIPIRITTNQTYAKSEKAAVT